MYIERFLSTIFSLKTRKLIPLNLRLECDTQYCWMFSSALYTSMLLLLLKITFNTKFTFVKVSNLLGYFLDICLSCSNVKVVNNCWNLHEVWRVNWIYVCVGTWLNRMFATFVVLKMNAKNGYDWSKSEVTLVSSAYRNVFFSSEEACRNVHTVVIRVYEMVIRNVMY